MAERGERHLLGLGVALGLLLGATLVPGGPPAPAWAARWSALALVHVALLAGWLGRRSALREQRPKRRLRAVPAALRTAADLKRLCQATGHRCWQARSGACVFGGEAGERTPAVLVVAKLSPGGEFVSVYGSALEDVGEPSAKLLQRLMEHNERLWHGKFVLTPAGSVDYRVECPAATCDVAELADCVTTCRQVLHRFHEELSRLT